MILCPHRRAPVTGATPQARRSSAGLGWEPCSRAFSPPHFVVALFTAVARVGFELCEPTGIDDVKTLALAERSLCPGWDRPGHRV
ncbi:hypothetical protein [Streptosporangium sp. CA-115845]|uniref:hypothetical protein n=1 Tax=Streptosporangium sp. CA-115845 TaxID=3240071 RepID=UPI003D93E7E0